MAARKRARHKPQVRQPASAKRKRSLEPAEPPAQPPGPAPRAPELVPGRTLLLPDRGELLLRESPGPPGAPVLLLLHGWFASAGLNWHQAFGPLGEHFRILAPDQRGHGRGIRSRDPFRLEDCADDAAAILDAVGIGSAIAVGYSMGGAVAQLLWRRHPKRVAGLVLAATSHQPIPNRGLFNTTMAAAAGTTRLTQLVTRLPRALGRELLDVLLGDPLAPNAGWAAAEVARHDLRMLWEAGGELGRFDAEPWLREVDVPTSVLITERDWAIAPEEQVKQALQIPDARVFCAELGHAGCTDPSFGDGLLAACQDVAARSAGTSDRRNRTRLRNRLRDHVESIVGGASAPPA